MPLRNLMQRPRSKATAAVATLALTALCAAGSSSASATSSPPAWHTTATSSPQRPTVVLVHGAFADASGFSAEIARLQADGYPVIAPADPLRGLTADADYVRSILATIPGPVILVGHSYGGAVISNAARGASNVVALVYLAAFIPDEGDSVATGPNDTSLPSLSQASMPSTLCTMLP